MRAALKKVSISSGIVLLMVAGIAAWHFPYSTDDALNREDALREFNEARWTPPDPDARPSASRDAWAVEKIPERVARFVQAFNLQDARILDVGSGSGELQDIVDDYTGMDAAGSAARFYHKRFVAGTATAMPFGDSEFDAAWSIRVLERTPNPEAALSEIRRVVKPGGYLYLLPAWNCVPWAAQGYEARPYSDFGLGGKLIKASVPVRRSITFQMAATVPVRMVRSATARLGPTRLHYRRLTPNHDEYWQADGDAVNSLDPVEVAAWFESRGDTCLNCLPGWKRLLQPESALIIRIGNKGTTSIRDDRQEARGPRLLSQAGAPTAPGM
jgi:SAM-dependent methyltransferase